MSTVRLNISLSREIEARARELIRDGDYTGLSDLLQCLVRDEYRRVFEPWKIGVVSPRTKTSVAALNDAAFSSTMPQIEHPTVVEALTTYGHHQQPPRKARKARRKPKRNPPPSASAP